MKEAARRCRSARSMSASASCTRRHLKEVPGEWGIWAELRQDVARSPEGYRRGRVFHRAGVPDGGLLVHKPGAQLQLLLGRQDGLSALRPAAGGAFGGG